MWLLAFMHFDTMNKKRTSISFQLDGIISTSA